MGLIALDHGLGSQNFVGVVEVGWWVVVMSTEADQQFGWHLEV